MESPHTTATTGHSMSAATFHTNMVVSSMEAAHTAHVSHALAGAARRRRGMRTAEGGRHRIRRRRRPLASPLRPERDEKAKDRGGEGEDVKVAVGWAMDDRGFGVERWQEEEGQHCARAYMSAASRRKEGVVGGIPVITKFISSLSARKL